MFDAWRYLKLSSTEFLLKTPREFSIMLSAEIERRHDDFEVMAANAMMMRAAYHKEKLKQRDLYKRPNSGNDERTAEDIRNKQKEVIERLSRFEEFKDLLTRKEVTDE